MLFEITDLSSVYVGMKLIKTNYQIAYFTYWDKVKHHSLASYAGTFYCP